MTPSLSDRLGIQSYCFRAFKTLPELIQALHDTGLSRLELWGGHLGSFDPAQADIAAAIDAFRTGGVVLTTCGVHGFDTNEASARRVFDFARAAGFSTISGDFRTDEALPLVERLCEEYDARVAIHNHGRKHRLGSPEALADLFARSSPRIGLCLDTAWMLDSQEDPVAIARRFRDRLYGLHLKDFEFDADRNHRDVIVGEGGLDLPALIRLLVEIGFDGYLTQEFEGNPEAPVPSCRQCVEAIRRTITEVTGGG